MTSRLLPLVLFAALLSAHPARTAAWPSCDAKVVIPLLTRTSDYGSLSRLETILGPPDASFRSGFLIYVFHLNDSTSLYVASPDRRRIFGIHRSAPGQNAEAIYEPLGEALMKPAPGSAPF